jgi:hypothetical protein
MEIYGWWTFAGGVLVLLLLYADFFYTTLSGNGDGYITRTLNRRMDSLMMLIRRKGPDTGVIYKLAGLIHLLFSLFVWISLLLIGTFLIFNSSPEAVVHGSTRIPADYTERFYYCCYMLSTLGIGDMVPGNSFGQYATSFLTFGGFTMLSIGLTYLLSILEGVQKKRQLASKIFGMGNTPLQIFKNHYETHPEWSKDELSDIREQINSHIHKFILFPIVHYFTTAKRNYSLFLAVTVLDSSLEIMIQTLEEKDSSANDALIHESLMVRQAIADLMQEMKRTVPSDFDKDKLKEIERERNAAMTGERHYFESERTLELHHYLRQEGWRWKDVYSYYPQKDQKAKIFTRNI